MEALSSFWESTKILPCDGILSKLNSIKTKEVERLGEVVHYLQGVHLIYIFYKYNNKI